MHLFRIRNINYSKEKKKEVLCRQIVPRQLPAISENRNIESPWHMFRGRTFETLYDPEKALIAGTLFPELDKPFVGRRAFRR